MVTHFRTCPLCEAMCGLEIETDGLQVARVRGDRANVWTPGFLCPGLTSEQTGRSTGEALRTGRCASP